MRVVVALFSLLTLATASAQDSASQNGESLFKNMCASCHTGEPNARAPAVETLRQRSPEAILEVLTNGAMRVQGSRLNGEQRQGH